MATRKLDPLQQSMVEDLHRIMEYVPHFKVAFDGLTDRERDTIEDRFLEYAWQLALANADPMFALSQPAADGMFKAFGGFVISCKEGRSMLFKTSDWTAVDTDTFDSIKGGLKDSRPNLWEQLNEQ